MLSILTLQKSKQKVASTIIFLLSTIALLISLILRLTIKFQPCTYCNILAFLAATILIASAITISSIKGKTIELFLSLISAASFLGILVSEMAFQTMGCASCSSQYQGIGFLGFSIYLYALSFNAMVLILSG